MVGESGSGRPTPTPITVPAPEDLVRVVALDGPAGSGKSTVARRVAEVLGWRFVDTGATYRAVTLAVLRAGIAPSDNAAVVRAAQEAEIELSTAPAESYVRLSGEDVSRAIRGPEVTAAVSQVSALPEVRARLIALQRTVMGTTGAVVEGRDIATVVAPRAGVKVYLDARPEVRARRRAGDAESGVLLPGGGTGAELTAVHEGLQRRDALDHQTNALAAAQGAVHLDTSDLTLDQVVEAIVGLVDEAGLRADPGAPADSSAAGAPSAPGGMAAPTDPAEPTAVGPDTARAHPAATGGTR